jgi:heme/copper-type cytochrome/quinol oxidase subunit 2
LLSALNKEVTHLNHKHPFPCNEKKPHFNIGHGLYAAFITTTLSASLCMSVSAATVWEKASEIMRDVYTQILGISTIAAIVTAAVALLMMNFSRSGRTVDESRAWLKRIIITWAVLNGLGFIMSYVTPFFSGGQWTAP